MRSNSQCLLLDGNDRVLSDVVDRAPRRVRFDPPRSPVASARVRHVSSARSECTMPRGNCRRSQRLTHCDEAGVAETSMRQEQHEAAQNNLTSPTHKPAALVAVGSMLGRRCHRQSKSGSRATMPRSPRKVIAERHSRRHRTKTRCLEARNVYHGVLHRLVSAGLQRHRRNGAGFRQRPAHRNGNLFVLWKPPRLLTRTF